MIQVGAAIIRQAGRILICRRQPGGSCSSLWEFPGGKREQGESMERCIVRECREELGVELELEDICGRTVYDYPDQTVDLTFYNARIEAGNMEVKVHQEVRWVESEDLKNYSFCPADEEIVRKLAQGALGENGRNIRTGGI